MAFFARPFRSKSDNAHLSPARDWLDHRRRSPRLGSWPYSQLAQSSQWTCATCKWLRVPTRECCPRAFSIFLIIGQLFCVWPLAFFVQCMHTNTHSLSYKQMLFNFEPAQIHTYSCPPTEAQLRASVCSSIRSSVHPSVCVNIHSSVGIVQALLSHSDRVLMRSITETARLFGRDHLSIRPTARQAHRLSHLAALTTVPEVTEEAL
ncbi:unnamed protein product [Protopolystoma xenopodis]|uniref:Uncharacterized protein n=1 Tax=Protopolystoma xenopodis TaxID=117903 RepID=A0A3S5C9B7_9PLAT|nr:unnamed protein product [Protopolystoma xenopodis]